MTSFRFSAGANQEADPVLSTGSNRFTGRVSDEVEPTISWPRKNDCDDSLFKTLLQRLAKEHDKEVFCLRAEISRLLRSQGRRRGTDEEASPLSETSPVERASSASCPAAMTPQDSLPASQPVHLAAVTPQDSPPASQPVHPAAVTPQDSLPASQSVKSGLESYSTEVSDEASVQALLRQSTTGSSPVANSQHHMLAPPRKGRLATSPAAINRQSKLLPASRRRDSWEGCLQALVPSALPNCSGPPEPSEEPPALQLAPRPHPSQTEELSKGFQDGEHLARRLSKASLGSRRARPRVVFNHGEAEETDSKLSDDMEASQTSRMSRHFWGIAPIEGWEAVSSALLIRAHTETMFLNVHSVWTRIGEDAEKRLPKDAADRKLFPSGMERWGSTCTIREDNAVCEFLQRFTVLPTGPFRSVWDGFGVTLGLHDLVMIPVQLAFNSEGGQLAPGADEIFTIVDFMGLAFWTLDLLLSFFTGYHTGEGFLEMRPRYIARHYLRSWLAMDVMIVLIDFVSLTTSTATLGYFRIGRILSRLPRFLRVVRLIRLIKLNEHWSQAMECFFTQYTFTLLGLLKMLVMICFANHYIACCWYWLSDLTKGIVPDSEGSWITTFIPAGSSVEFCYFTSLHWSLTQFTPASMQIVPMNIYERIYNVIVIIGAMVAFSSFVSSITNAMNEMRQINASRLNEDAQIRQFFKDYSISSTVAHQVWKAVKKKRTYQRAHRVRLQDISIIAQLPPRMQDELIIERYTPVLVNHRLFYSVNCLWPEFFRAVVKYALSEKQLVSGEEYLGEDKDVNAMFICTNGAVEYHPSEGPINDKDRLVVDIGRWACELALWAIGATVSGPFVAQSKGAELIFLHSADFQRIVRQADVELRVLISKYATRFVADANKDAVDPENENLLRNIPSQIDMIYNHAKDEAINARSTALFEHVERSPVRCMTPRFSHRSRRIAHSPAARSAAACFLT